MKKLVLSLLCLAFLALSVSPAQAQLFKKKKPKTEEKKKPKKGGAKPYKKVITKEAQTQKGLFTTHKVGEQYYFELPKDLLEKEILVVSRISGFVKNLNFGGAGTKSRPQQVIRWQKKGEKIMMRSVSYNSVASHDDPVYESVKNNNFEPVVQAFPIEAYSKDSSSFVINVGALFTSDVPMIGAMYDSQRKRFQIRGVDGKRSFIDYTKAFPNNVEVRHVLTYTGSRIPDNQLTNTLSIEMNQSFIALPEEKMQPRYFDERVAYFSIRQTDYSSEKHEADMKRFITRWKLVPKDMEAFKRGELVEPVKPIVYYIDPATPLKWRKYLKQGVDDWKGAFEAAGFKNAIMAKDAPSKEEDPDWSPEDVRYSVIRYITTDIQNAMGPHVHDPRTGEILESDIMWYHNVMNLLRNWYFIQTAATNTDARGVQFKDEVMGELIRFVAAHEVGHTIGLPHNMGSSAAYPVDSLRSPTFTATHGTAPSIMDYARFNYIAQPEDGVTNLHPRIGEYDVYSIEWGYKPIPQASSSDAEKPVLNEWIKAKADDLAYRFGAQTRSPHDPTAQTEDLGDDAMKASTLGIANLKRIVPKLVEWTRIEGENDFEMQEIYNNIIAQFRRYIGHVSTNVGGVYQYNKSNDQEGAVFTHVEKEKQERAMKFLEEQVFQTPTWLLEQSVLERVSMTETTDKIEGLQSYTLFKLFENRRIQRLLENEAINGANAYTLMDVFDDSRKAVFKSGTMDTYQRKLQNVYVDKMMDLIKAADERKVEADAGAFARYNLKQIQQQVKSSVGGNATTRAHNIALAARLDSFFN